MQASDAVKPDRREMQCGLISSLSCTVGWRKMVVATECVMGCKRKGIWWEPVSLHVCQECMIMTLRIGARLRMDEMFVNIAAMVAFRAEGGK